MIEQMIYQCSFPIQNTHPDINDTPRAIKWKFAVIIDKTMRQELIKLPGQRTVVVLLRAFMIHITCCRLRVVF